MRGACEAHCMPDRSTTGWLGTSGEHVNFPFRSFYMRLLLIEKISSTRMVDFMVSRATPTGTARV